MKKIIHWLNFFKWFFFKEKPKKISKIKEKAYKTRIRIFFDGGYYTALKPIIDIPIYKFGITDFDFKLFKKYLLITITLENPSIIIGVHASVIDALTEYLSNQVLKIPVKINLKESKIWH